MSRLHNQSINTNHNASKPLHTRIVDNEMAKLRATIRTFHHMSGVVLMHHMISTSGAIDADIYINGVANKKCNGCQSKTWNLLHISQVL